MEGKCAKLKRTKTTQNIQKNDTMKVKAVNPPSDGIGKTNAGNETASNDFRGLISTSTRKINRLRFTQKK